MVAPSLQLRSVKTYAQQCGRNSRRVGCLTAACEAHPNVYTFALSDLHRSLGGTNGHFVLQMARWRVSEAEARGAGPVGGAHSRKRAGRRVGRDRLPFSAGKNIQ